MFLCKNNYCYQYIPKNASSFITNHLRDLHWSEINLNQIDKNYTVIAVLRDPYTRWISGFVEDVTGMNDKDLSNKIISVLEDENTWFLDWIFTSKTFNIGWHTKLQKDWIYPSLIPQTVFFKIENNLNLKLHHWLVGEGLPNKFQNLPAFNSRQDSVVYQKINSYLLDAKNKDKKDMLLEYLQSEYDFINSITFY
jgi:hypothetical protein